MSATHTHETRLAQLDWAKTADGLLPAIVQHADDGRVLMLGYMNREALARTQEIGQVTFFSRSRQTLWTKGETSGHTLQLVDIAADCDRDTLLVRARPRGPTCHLGTDSCFDLPGEQGAPPKSIASVLSELEHIIGERAAAAARDDTQTSYVATLLQRGLAKVAQKVGEEGVEVALATVGENDEALVGEAADLLFHLLIALQARGLSLSDVTDELVRRRR